MLLLQRSRRRLRISPNRLHHALCRYHLLRITIHSIYKYLWRSQSPQLWNNTLYRPGEVVSSVGSYISQGCYFDNVNGRTLASTSLVEPNMTVEACVGYCNNKGGNYAGVEYSDECYCGSGLIHGCGSASSGCGMLCAGNQYEICGGPNRLNVYLLSA